MSSSSFKADLHVHSTASDGTSTPSELVALSLQGGLTHLALTDHDSVEGLAEAMAAAASTPVTLIAGVELSSVTEDGRDVHMLGYFIDPANSHLLAHLIDLRAARLRRAEVMVASLTDAGLSVNLEDVLRYSNGGSVGRSHVARALVASGHAHTIRDAFERFLGRGRPHYVVKDVRSPQETIRVVHDAGGIAVVAHPGIIGLDDVVTSLAPLGLDGIEAYHADHTPEQRARYVDLAHTLGLLTTGGTDYHGQDAPNAQLGSVAIPAEALTAFLARGDHR